MNTFLKFNIRKILVTVLLVLSNSTSVFAKIDSDVDLTVSASSGYSSEKIRNNNDYTDYWLLSGGTRFLYTLSGKKGNVRGQVRMEVLGDEANGLWFELSRAYIRKRMRLGQSYAMQIEIGKNTVAWGEGDYYNAGDVIFGADPKARATGFVSEFRDFSFWQGRAFIPLNKASYVELLIGIPNQKYPIFFSESSTDTPSGAGGVMAPTTDIKKVGSGARIHAEIKPFQFETGGYSRFVKNTISPYVSLALPLKVRFYVASGMDISYDKDADVFAEQFQEHFGVSGGVLSTFNVGAQSTLTLQGEMLRKNNLLKTQVNAIWFFTRVFGFILRGDATFETYEYAILAGPQWKPENGLTIGMYSNVQWNINDNPNTNTIYTGGTIMMQYKF